MSDTKLKYNQIKAMLAISKASFRGILRSPSAVIFSLVFPLIFILVFGFIKGNSIRLDVGIDPRCDTNAVVYKLFSKLPSINIERNKTSAEMEDLLHKGRLDAVINIYTSNNEKSRVVNVITSKASREKGLFVKSILVNMVDKQNIYYLRELDKKNSTNDNSFHPTEIKETEVQGREYKMIDFI